MSGTQPTPGPGPAPAGPPTNVPDGTGPQDTGPGPDESQLEPGVRPAGPDEDDTVR
ncbi:hypothetical protein [Cellulomonas endophytica]|uniref:hypothetical protein n=1 Tax=Cellulomonas endophytica TaxID=2494735 RepID=UPI0013E93C60|nr:hypothetical protein [Cellulomonas endophytica]